MSLDFTEGKIHWRDLKNILFPEGTSDSFWENLQNAVTNLDAPNLFLLAAPVMLLLMIFEMMYSSKKQMGLYGKNDLIGSIGVGSIYLAITGATKVFTFYLVWMGYYYIAPFTIPVTWWSFILCLVFYDFLRYGAHRIAHEQRFWWATHITHHSSEHYNFTVNFRLSWVDQLKLVFFMPIALAGFDPIQFFVVHQLGVLYQFWQHTELIPPQHPIIEYFFVTPTNHKVHHGKNKDYIDKNYGSTLIIWDRMFGTYQEPGEKPIYGIKGDVKHRQNPAYLVFHEFVDIAHDFWNAPNWRKRWQAIFTAPGTYSHED